MTKREDTTGLEAALLLSPKEFLKARRPERFSDTLLTEEPLLDRSMLEYHLHTMTSRSQEVAFATFARHIVEREICPNLLPQTGPTGGGDSKVDSETYPVSDALALGWYTGMAREASTERWGFAFSAKKAWRAKVKSDVKSAIETKRGYKKLFFVSNQYVRDKERAEVEDELTNAYEVDVRILDRTWILDKVFSNKHEALAVHDLELSTAIRTTANKGPLDIQRERDRDEIENRIQKALREERLGIQLVEDCLEAADLSRQLEHPRDEIEGLYGRAERIAVKCGTRHQRVRCAYELAWTTFWWFEDYERFSGLYGMVEQQIKGTESAYELELLTNLWSLLQGAVARGKLDQAMLPARTQTLKEELGRLSHYEEERPSASLHARSLHLYVDVFLKLAEKQPVDPVLPEFEKIVHASEGLIGFPVEPLIEVLAEFGEVFGGSHSYDKLFETIVAAQRGRKSEVAAARMILKRGEQLVKADQPYKAIQALGVSLHQLYKHESRADIMYALYLSAYAFEQVGLLWAARGNLLTAASIAASEYWNYGKIIPAQAACYRRLKWVELRLGRIPQSLAWHEVEVVTRAALSSETISEQPSEDEIAFDAILGILLLKAELWDLKSLSKMPDVLDRLGLFSASIAVMYALGYENEIREDFFSATRDLVEVRAFFLQWRDQPASEEVPDRPILYDEQKVTLRSRVLGCEIIMKADNVPPCLELAESILAALESVLSTGMIETAAAREPMLTITVRKSDFAKEPFELKLENTGGRPHIEIACALFDPHALSSESQRKIRDSIFELLATVFARIVVAENTEVFFEKLARDELALDRSLNFTGSFVTIANVLGHAPKNRLCLWIDEKDRDYPPKRLKVWDADKHPSANQTADSEPRRPRFGKGEPPAELIDHSRVKHTEYRTVSLIRETLWDKAKWMGVVYAGDDVSPPIMSFMFREREAATQIFQGWKVELGGSDSEERLRISLICGINRLKPDWYRIIVGSNPEKELGKEGVKYGVFVSRVNTITPQSRANLDRFLRGYRKAGKYFLSAAVAPGDTSESGFKPEFINVPYLLKRELHVRNAWEVARHDPDTVAIFDDDTPIIPEDQPNAPVLELIRWKQSRH